MNVPCDTHLINQSFNSEFIEFVWQFPRTSGYHDQFICQIWAPKPVIYMECGVVNEAGDYTDPPVEFKLGYGHLDVGEIITSPLNWPNREFPAMYNYFTNGKDLIPLIAEVQAYLKSL